MFYSGEVSDFTESHPNGDVASVPCTPEGALYTSRLHGNVYGAGYYNNVYVGRTPPLSAAAGVTLHLSTTASPSFGLYNPTSNYLLELIRYTIYPNINVDVTTNILYRVSFFGIGIQNFFTSPSTVAAASTSLVTAANLGAPVNPQGYFWSSPNTSINMAQNTVAARKYIPSGINIPVNSGGAATANATNIEENFEGSIILGPGWGFTPVNANASVTGLFQMSLTWAEWPIPN